VALRRAFSYLLIGAVLPLAGMEFWQYRVRSVVSAAVQFMPITAVHLVVPAGTQIRAVLKNVFSMSTKPGDRVLAFVSEPVMVDGSTAIPAGARLNGFVEQITKAKPQVETWLRFNSLVIGQKPFHIETEPVLINAAVESDFEILSNALDTVADAGIGVALGASRRTEAGITAGLTVGAMRGAAVMDNSNIKITVILAQPLDLIR
jgi:hypothetical protein